MGKSMRSKIKRRWRALRRQHVDKTITIQEVQKVSKKLEASIIGVEYRQKEKKNAFLHPNDPEAQFPQTKPARVVDLRSSAIPGSGLQYVGAYRKKQKQQSEEEQKEEQMEVEKVRPKIGKIERRRKQCKKSKKIVVF